MGCIHSSKWMDSSTSFRSDLALIIRIFWWLSLIFSIRFLSLRNLSFKIMLRCSELVCWRYEGLLMDEMHMIDRNKIERSAPFVLAQVSSVSNDAQGDTLLINGTTYTVVGDRTNG